MRGRTHSRDWIDIILSLKVCLTLVNPMCRLFATFLAGGTQGADRENKIP